MASVGSCRRFSSLVAVALSTKVSGHLSNIGGSHCTCASRVDG